MKRREFIEKSALAAGGILLSAAGADALAKQENGKKMKVLLINGSPRPKGNTSLALAEVAKQLEKNGIDSETVWIGNKPAAAVAVCRRGGATASFETLNMPFLMLNMPVVASQYWNIVYGLTPGQASLDQEGMQTMRTLANNMAWLLKSTGGKPAPARDGEPATPMNFIR